MHFIDYEVLRTNAKSVLNGLMQFLNLEGPRSGAQAHDSRKVPFKARGTTLLRLYAALPRRSLTPARAGVLELSAAPGNAPWEH